MNDVNLNLLVEAFGQLMMQAAWYRYMEDHRLIVWADDRVIDAEGD